MGSVNAYLVRVEWSVLGPNIFIKKPSGKYWRVSNRLRPQWAEHPPYVANAIYPTKAGANNAVKSITGHPELISVEVMELS